MGTFGQRVKRFFGRRPDALADLARRQAEAAEALARTEEAIARLLKESARRDGATETFRNYVGQALTDIGNEVVHHRREVEALFGALKRPATELIDELKTRVEPYQPLYGYPEAANEHKRACVDRARAIERAIDVEPAALRLLDLGSSLGYFSFYFAERGADVQGIDANPDAVALARHVGAYNGIKVDFRAAEVTPEFIGAIAHGQYDAALVLSLLHHVIHERGLDAVRAMLAALCARVPLVFVELATKQEDVDFEWRQSLPDDPAEVFADCEGVEVVRRGEFPTHLSRVPRPLFLLRWNSVVVNGWRHPFERSSTLAYPGAASIGKTFYFGRGAFIKRCRITNEIIPKENLRQLIREVANYENIRDAWGGSRWLPALKDYQIDRNDMYAVFEPLEAENLLDLVNRGERVDPAWLAGELLKAVADLRRMGRYHNDLRVWNIMVARSNDESASRLYLIDLGHAAFKETEPTLAALLWIFHDVGRGAATLDVGWPVETPPGRNARDYDPALRELAGKLLAAENLDAFLRDEALLP